ncbi:hypothetical protein COU37_05930 [Candidatus Micrarchaeota archaeon CG10_big_fil_rev_8_21_14_0_10_45_29]|nr:MAG: hypothetical protein COU37_05930 [Candidatus Micrarchaeota archaeon CG10_big_fil_rev_8_21_14_0_10_45_29]
MKAFKQPFIKGARTITGACASANTAPHQHVKRRAILASADLALTFFIILTITIPTLNHLLYAQTPASYNANNAQKLSAMAQESTFAYVYSAAMKNNTLIIHPPSSQGNFAKIGFLSEDFSPSAQYLKERGANLSLRAIAYYISSPPQILQKNQMCIKRKMLDSATNPISFWACGY